MLSSLTSAIGRVAPGRAEQRDVIMPLRLGDGKAQRHDIEEWWIATRDTPAAKVVADGKTQFITSNRQGLPADQRLIGAAVGIRYSRLNTMGFFAGELIEPDGDADGRTAGVRVEHMGAEPAVDNGHALARNLACDPESRDEEHFLQRRRELRREIVPRPALELRQDGIARVPAHTDDEGEAELRLVGVVQPMEAREFLFI